MALTSPREVVRPLRLNWYWAGAPASVPKLFSNRNSFPFWSLRLTFWSWFPALTLDKLFQSSLPFSNFPWNMVFLPFSLQAWFWCTEKCPFLVSKVPKSVSHQKPRLWQTLLEIQFSAKSQRSKFLIANQSFKQNSEMLTTITPCISAFNIFFFFL